MISYNSLQAPDIKIVKLLYQSPVCVFKDPVELAHLNNNKKMVLPMFKFKKAYCEIT